jgi:MFS family permease
LRRRNYRLYVAGQVLSTTGTWVQLVAEGWLVVRLTSSGLALGVTTALQFTPLLFLGAYGGLIVDRFDRRRLLLATQLAAALLSLATGLLTATGVIRVWMVFVAAFLLGCVNVFDSPGRQSFTRELVGEDVANAVALNNAVATGARFVGPAIGGLLVASAGIATCFLVNAGSYAAVMLALGAIDVHELAVEERVARARGQVREGLRYVRRHVSLRTVLVMLAITSAFGFNFQVVLPLLADEEFHRGGGTYGLLMSALGLGALVGSLVVAALSAATPRRVAWFSVAVGAALAGLAAAPDLPVALAAATVVGVSFSLFLASASGSLQVDAAPGMRGRVMSLYSIAFLGVAPIGGPAVGAVAQAFGPRAGLVIGAAASVCAGLLGIRLRRSAA